MKLQVERACKEKGISFSFHFEEPAAGLGDVTAFPWHDERVHVEGTYWFDGLHIVVQGIIRTRGTYTCSRCLLLVSVKREATLSEIYGTEAELPDDVLPYDGEYIDLTETIRETLILSEPMQVLCRSTCAGLCPACGANLNEEHCSCPTDTIDPRLAVLEELLRSKH